MTITVTELGYVGVGVKNLDAWKSFACDILGLEFADDNEGDRAYLRMDYWHHRIVLHKNDADDLMYAGFRVAGPEEFKGMQKQLSGLGIKFKVGSKEEAAERRVLELLKTEDPAGVPVEIFHGPLVDGAKPFRPGRGMHGKFNTGTGGMGHIVVRDRGVDKSYEFYNKALGLTGSVEGMVPLPNGMLQTPTFMHCNTRDHTIAFGAGPMKRILHHIMIETNNIDDVGHAYDLVLKAKLPLLMTLGKHTNDDMLSFYVQTPSGFFIEYGGVGRDANPQSEYCVRDTWGHDIVGMHLMADF